MREKSVNAINGWLMLFVVLALFAAAIAGVFRAAQVGQTMETSGAAFGWTLGTDIAVWLVASFLAVGFFIVEPNGSKVLLLFGNYKGTVKSSGFYWTNPLMTRRKVSLRVRTLNGERIKVNDLSGNPVEIAAVVVWRVEDTYEASFEVDDYVDYVDTQSETAVRHLASIYQYDAEDDTVSLRRNTAEVSEDLKVELQERLGRAGVRVLEARLSHLAYASEIAGAMLRRQQAAAIIAARQRIVDGAVGMVEMALKRLEEDGTLQLDEDRKAVMVSNLMVVLCSEHAAQPVLNTGTLYQ